MYIEFVSLCFLSLSFETYWIFVTHAVLWYPILNHIANSRLLSGQVSSRSVSTKGSMEVPDVRDPHNQLIWDEILWVPVSPKRVCFIAVLFFIMFGMTGSVHICPPWPRHFFGAWHPYGPGCRCLCGSCRPLWFRRTCEPCGMGQVKGRSTLKAFTQQWNVHWETSKWPQTD